MSPPSRPGGRPSCPPPRSSERAIRPSHSFFLRHRQKRIRRVRPMRLAADERHLTLARDAGHRHGDQAAAGDLGDRAAARQQRHAELQLDRALDAVEARQRDHHVQRDVALLEQPQHALARRRRIVVRDDRLAARRPPSSPAGASRARATAARAAPARRCRPTTSSSPSSAGRNVSAPKSRLPCCTSTAICRAGTRRTSIAMSGNSLAEARHQRQQRVDGRLVGANQHAPAAQIAQLAHRRLGFLGQPHQPLPVVLQHPAGVGERAALRRSVEQLLAELVLETPHRLADGRLRAVHLGGGARETALVGHGQKDLAGLPGP